MKNLQTITLNIAPVLEKTDVSKCFVFGSYAKGNETEESDIDLLVEFYPGKEPDLFSFISLKNTLEARLGKKVDIATEDALSPYIRTDVLKTARMLYERK